MRINDKKRGWLDGKPWNMWPLAEHIGWTVVTAGPVDLEIEGRTPAYNNGRLVKLPPDYPMILKEITPDGYAYAYHHENGVMKMPAELLKPWQR